MLIDRPTVADYPPGANMPPRVIADFEFVWMLRGQARFITQDDSDVLSPGQLLLIPPGVRHGFDWDRMRPSRHGYVHFGPDPGAEPIVVPQLRPMTPQDPLGGLCAYLLWLGQLEQANWQQAALHAVRLMLKLILSAPLPATQTLPELTAPLAAAVGYLRQRWSQMPLPRIGVAELAVAAAVSRSYLSRLFRAGFGLSPAPALERLRCSRAETLLIRTNMSVESIAYQCGFADLSHFSHRFTSIEGVPPSVYRAARNPQTSVLDYPGVRRLAHLVWA